MIWASADSPRSVPNSATPTVLATGVSSATLFAAATAVAPVGSVATPSSAAARASDTSLLVVDGVVATASLRGTFAGIALQAILGVKTRIDAKKMKESRGFLRAELTG